MILPLAQGSDVFITLDSGCNRTCFTAPWRRAAEKLGVVFTPLYGEERSYTGIGTARTLGKRKFEFQIARSDGSVASGEIVGQELAKRRGTARTRMCCVFCHCERKVHWGWL